MSAKDPADSAGRSDPDPLETVRAIASLLVVLVRVLVSVLQLIRLLGC
jgi:hypothetical protein